MPILAQFHRLLSHFTGNAKPVAPAVDRRQTERSVVKDAGFVSFPKRPAFPPVRCKVDNLSKDGARIEFSGPAPEATLIESGMRLYIQKRDHERECEVIWQKAGVLGLKFKGLPLDPSRSYRELVT